MEDKEKIKQELLEELKKEYKLIPIKEARFTVKDILDKYMNDILVKLNANNMWSTKQSIENAIRKIVAMHFGYENLSNVKTEDRIKIREEIENFIKEYILGGK